MVAEISATLATYKALLSAPNLLSAGAYSPPTPTPTNTTYFAINGLGKIMAQGWELTGGGSRLKTSREGWVLLEKHSSYDNFTCGK